MRPEVLEIAVFSSDLSPLNLGQPPLAVPVNLGKHSVQKNTHNYDLAESKVPYGFDPKKVSHMNVH